MHTEGLGIRGDADKEITGVSYDSRKVKRGDAFVAITGEHVDGHAFIEDAIRRGAGAIVYETRAGDFSGAVSAHPDITWVGVEDSRHALAALSSRFYGNPSEEMTVIGITGTNGKTTTSYLIKSILERWGRVVGLIGTINYVIGETLYDAPHTTPESPDFQALLRQMAQSGCDCVVSEVSSHALSQRRVDFTRFKVVIFTNLTRDHLDFHGTMEDYFRSKERLFTELLEEGGVAVINVDDPYGIRLVRTLTGQEDRASRRSTPPARGIVTYSAKTEVASLTALDIKTSFRGTSFKVRVSLKGEATEHEMTSPLVGVTNVYNILSALGAALSLDVPIETIREAIASTGVVKGRFEKVDLGQDFLAVVDYAHSEDSLERLLHTARQVLESSRPDGKGDKAARLKGRRPLIAAREKGRVITVFGCGGNRDRGKRPKMGAIAATMSDFVIITSDNPRDEAPHDIIADIEGGITSDNYVVVPDRRLAITMGVKLASPGDSVVVAGKGHEEYQEIRGRRSPFSDREVLEEAIRQTMSRHRRGGKAR